MNEEEIEDLFKETVEKKEQLEKSLQAIMSNPYITLLLRFREIWNQKFPLGSTRRKFADNLILKIISLSLGIKQKDIKHSLLNHSIKFSSLPIDEQYKIWLENHQMSEKQINLVRGEINSFKIKPKISLVTPVYNVDEKWLRLAINSVRNQIYDNWELCITDDASSKHHVRKVLDEYTQLDKRIKVNYLSKNLGIAGASNNCIDMATGDFIGILDNDDELYPHALFEVVKRINEKPDVEILYSDEDKIDMDGQRVDPYFKPDWSPDLLMTGNYITHFCVLNRQLLKSLNGFRSGYDGSQDFDLFLRATDVERKVEHIPKILYGWRKIPGSAAAASHYKSYANNSSIRAILDALDRRGIKGKVEQVLDSKFFRVRYDFGSPHLSIILLCHGNLERAKRCIESIKRASYRNFELIILDNSPFQEIRDFCKSLNHKVIRMNEKFNASKMYNIGASYANGEFLLFMTDDVEVMSSDWLDALLESSFPEKVAVAGPTLLTSYDFSDMKYYFIANAGTVVGTGNIVSNAFAGISEGNYYNRNLHLTIRNCSAVTKNCMIVKKEVFDKVGGWDEKIFHYEDVDLCLRISKLGYRIVYTPYARLLQHEITRTVNRRNTFFISKWKSELQEPDPFYNINLSQTSAKYGISPFSNFSKSIAILMEVYLDWNELQQKFPEARYGDFKNLLKWTTEYGINAYSEFYPLMPFEMELRNHYQFLLKENDIDNKRDLQHQI